jgi:hypothetical protein
MLRTGEECRTGINKPYDGTIAFRGQGDAIRIQADCIEAGIYDPCNDAGGRWGEAQCAWAHLEVAQRRIHRAESQLLELSQQSEEATQIAEVLSSYRDRWKTRSKEFCQKRNRIFLEAQAREYEAAQEPDLNELAKEPEPPDESDGDDGEKLGFCLRRVTEERAQELERFLAAVNGVNGNLVGVRLLTFLRNDPEFRVAQPTK